MYEPKTEFRRRLEATGRPYEALMPLGGNAARVRFLGTLEGSEVLWNATLITLEHYCRGLPPAERALGVRQFIALAPVQDGRGSITIALNVPRIDGPAILKTIIMIRQWKRLRPGRHEYGELCHLDGSL